MDRGLLALIHIGKTAPAGMRALGCAAALAALAAAPVRAQQDGDMPLLNGCSSYVDATADDADRTLAWGYDIENDPRRCLKVRVGQVVTFDGNVSRHPIDALGGARPNPFAGSLSSATSFTFDQTGGFGFVCTYHEEMLGVIWVVA